MNTNSNPTLNSREYGYDDKSAASLTSSAVSWGAIVAGAAAGASFSLILLILGVGLGLSSVSPWVNEGISAQSFGISTIIWLTLTQLLSSALGGYLAGRLRTKWINVHTDEVYFRDTAHGFLAWAVASLATAVLLTSVIASILDGGASMVRGVSNTATMAAIAVNESQTQGLSQQEVEQRVSDIYSRIQSELKNSETANKEAAETARKASAYAALWIFLALLIGAFTSSLAATLGGKQRDAMNTHNPSL
jgi:hypothetical protein